MDNFDRSLCDKDTPIKEQQFVTQLVDGRLLTERIVQGTSKRLVGTTLRELEREGASSSTVAEERAADAEREKLAGNQAFQKREYGQAAVHYTVARAAGLRRGPAAGRGAREPVGVLPEAGRPRPRAGGRGGGGRLRRYVREGPLPARPGAARAVD